MTFTQGCQEKDTANLPLCVLSLHLCHRLRGCCSVSALRLNVLQGSLQPLEESLDEAFVQAYGFFKERGDCESIARLMEHAEKAPEGSLPRSGPLMVGALEWIQKHQRKRASQEVDAAIGFFTKADVKNNTPEVSATHRAAVLNGKTMELDRSLMAKMVAPLALYILHVMAKKFLSFDCDEMNNLLSLLEA